MSDERSMKQLVGSHLDMRAKVELAHVRILGSRLDGVSDVQSIFRSTTTPSVKSTPDAHPSSSLAKSTMFPTAWLGTLAQWAPTSRHLWLARLLLLQMET